MLAYRNQPVTQTETQTRKQAQAIQAQIQNGTGQQAYRFRNWSSPTGAVPGVEDMPPAHIAAYSGSNVRKRAPVLTVEGCGYAGAPLTTQDRAAMQAVPGADEALAPAARQTRTKPDDKQEARPKARRQYRLKNTQDDTQEDRHEDKLEARQDAEKMAAIQKLYRQKMMMRLRSLIPLLDNTGGAVRKLFMESCYNIKNEYRLREETERDQEAQKAPKAQDAPKAPPATCNTDNAETLSCSFSPRF